VEIDSMHIVCPHCTTSYAIDLATLGAAGRTVRCSRCKEVWQARPQDAVEVAASVPAMAAAGTQEEAAEPEALASQDSRSGEQDPPIVDSPSISGDWPADADGLPPAGAIGDSSIAGQQVTEARAAGRRGRPWRRKSPKRPGSAGRPVARLPTVCVAMGALVLALVIWRVDVVRLLPQTAAFYQRAGLEVNLRGLVFKDVKITNETVEGKPALVIEGMIEGRSQKPVELPRLRFSVRDAHGVEIYAWNAVLEQAVLKPGETAWFKSRLASPPPEGRNIDVRYFNKRDVAGGDA
jgi:predicted Zn finger-like uncharacterized protein